MAPHPVLLLDDVLREVLGYLRHSGDESVYPMERIYASKRRRDLARAARVCRAFYEPAVATLWRILPNLKVAWTLLPSFTLIRNEDAEDDANFYYIFTREIRREEWDRFCQYAKHVRVIMKHTDQYRIQPSVYFHLSRHSQVRPLFPYLQDLSWNAMTPHHTDLHLLVTPALQKLTIWLVYKRDTETAAGERVDLDLLFQTTVSQLRGLRELQVYSQEPNIDIDVLAWMSIPQLQNLRTLRLESLCYIEDLDFIAGIATLPQLTELSLSLDASLDPVRSSHLRGFSALQTLTLTNADSEDLLSPFASPDLHTVTFFLEHWDGETVQRMFSGAIARFPALRSLAVDLKNEARNPHAPILDFHTLFGALPSAPTLEEFSIHTPASIITAVGGDHDLARLAEAWPRLRVLRFVTTLQGVVSPAALVAFAQHCPRLHRLQIRGVEFRDTMVD